MAKQSPARLWAAVLGDLQVQVARPSFDTFLKDTAGRALDGGCLVVTAPTAFVAEYLQKRMRGVVERALERVAADVVDVRFEFGQGPAPAPRSEAAPAAETPAVDPPAGMLDPRYTFDRFVVGAGSALAAAAAHAAAETPGVKYNPVFVYARAGLGKTHLLHAIGHRARQRGLDALYVTSDRFVGEFVAAIREGRGDALRDRYRRPDVLLMDDVQFLSGKEQTQEGLFHIFNELHHAGRQIALACDRPPHAVERLDDRLRSRFAWGLQADIQPPDLETRLAILRDKAAAIGAKIPAGVLEEIAGRESRTVRDLEGALNRVLAYADMTGAPVSTDLAFWALGEPVPASQTAAPAGDVVKAAARCCGLRAEDLRGKGRGRVVAVSRHLAMYVLRVDLGLGLEEVGKLLGGRNRSTILAGIAATRQRLQSDVTGGDVAALLAAVRERGGG